ncbi:hypothetical protein J1605_008170 [Eschrichtius robustus]|uniref:Uncharacterized protein n=1 Tax=Eschrichtius robustus TaxID=9764 RepID=A0AB34GWN7_ESCRO|nr:hypothetical protein J1605_008170 [Eschrichtius robustus]
MQSPSFSSSSTSRPLVLARVAEGGSPEAQAGKPEPSHAKRSAASPARARRPRAEGFPCGSVVENLPANAGDTGSRPGLGRSHMPRSNWAHEPQLLSLRVWSLCSATREAAMVRGPRTAMRRGPRSRQLEKALAQRRGPNTAKNKN